MLPEPEWGLLPRPGRPVRKLAGRYAPPICDHSSRAAFAVTVTRARRFDAVSLDLWSTSLVERPGAEGRLREERCDFLATELSPVAGPPIPGRDIRRAMKLVHEEIASRGRHPIELDPVSLVGRYAQALGVRPSRPITEIGTEYSRVGLADDGPASNPEAESLISSAEARGVPVIAITDTARTEPSWQEFLHARTELRFRHIVTSCEVGRAKPDPAIFRDAARRLGLPPEAILHIGDRWDRDVQGALRVGFGAVLYSGLRDSISSQQDPLPDPEEFRRVGVLHVRRLDDPSVLSLLG